MVVYKQLKFELENLTVSIRIISKYNLFHALQMLRDVKSESFSNTRT